MIGGLTSSLALAQHTADAATAHMAKVSRQIATGKEVSSAKDDGARFVQAAALKSQQAAIRGRADIVSILQAGSAEQSGELMEHRDLFKRARDVLLAAKTHPANSSARQQLQAEFNSIIATLDGAGTDGSVIVSGYALQADGTWGIQAAPGDPVLNGRTVFITTGAGAHSAGWTYTGPSVPFSLRTTDVAAGNAAHLDTAIWWANTFQEWVTLNEQQVAGDQKWLDSVETRERRDMDRLDASIGSLTDADLGKLSTQNQQAQVRQQLALDTIKTALTAYGNYASGLLGNVQRTQRGVLA